MTDSTERTSKTVRRVWGRVLVAVVFLAVALVSLREWVLQGLVFPVRIEGGSMADSLRGAHWQVVCADCGWAFDCGAQSPPRDDMAVCPNCGFPANDVSRSTVRRGDRVLIDKASLAVREPRRWEVVALMQPDAPRQLAVKRIVGLPGERISIRSGNVYVDGRIASKTLAELRRMAVMVHDDRYRPQQTPSLPPRWQATGPGTLWTSQGAGYVRRADGRENESLAKGALDWLAYRHWRCMPSPLGRTEWSPVLDNYGYNQGVSRELHEADDLMLQCRVVLSGSGTLAVEATHATGSFQLQLKPQERSAELFHAGHNVAQENVSFELAAREFQLELALCDGRALVALDGHTVMTYEFDPSSRAKNIAEHAYAVGAAGLSVELRDVRIYRDVYYLPPLAPDEWTASRPLGDDEYFVLGDNVPASHDSRQWPGGPGVPRKLLVGRVLPVPDARRH